MSEDVSVREATPGDIPLLLEMIGELADYEKLTDLVVATEELYRQALFPSIRPLRR